MVQEYGAAYVTIHRADLHQLLVRAVQGREGVFSNHGQPVEEILG